MGPVLKSAESSLRAPPAGPVFVWGAPPPPQSVTAEGRRAAGSGVPSIWPVAEPALGLWVLLGPRDSLTEISPKCPKTLGTQSPQGGKLSCAWRADDKGGTLGTCPLSSAPAPGLAAGAELKFSSGDSGIVPPEHMDLRGLWDRP